ncbi:hypothetical protein NFI96_006924 [Prochilodus magdalenae]|nr:hypothetical protein NFI96_006924 [Prochilodus magdalenae]
MYACASMSVYLGQQKEQEEYSAFTIQDPKETFRTIKEIRDVLEELKTQHADTEALTDQPGTMPFRPALASPLSKSLSSRSSGTGGESDPATALTASALLGRLYSGR